MKVPWKDSLKWKPDYWYPLTASHDVNFGNKEHNIENATWDLYRLDPEIPKDSPLYGDIVCMCLELTFPEAVKIANRMNATKLFLFPWAKELE